MLRVVLGLVWLRPTRGLQNVHEQLLMSISKGLSAKFCEIESKLRRGRDVRA